MLTLTGTSMGRMTRRCCGNVAEQSNETAAVGSVPRLRTTSTIRGDLMQRRTLFTLATGSATLATFAPAVAAGDAGDSDQQQGRGDLNAALGRFLALPGTKSYLIHAGQGGSLGRIAHRPDLFLFTASAYKTFVLGQYLRDIEAGLLSEDEQLAIDDSVRMIASPVFIELAGTTEARSVLEAMIAHSDNIATDRATGKVGADRVRALIAQAGLRSIRIPDSTRRFFSYLLGAPAGVDLGWPGILQALDHPPGRFRPPLNDVITLAGNARDFVSWYEQVLGGAFFAKPETLTEFKRIQAMSEQIVKAVPPDTPAYAKGGELAALLGFPRNTKSFAGQIVVGGEKNTPVTFCFIVNWDGLPSDFPAVEAEFFAAIKGILGVIKQAL
jgi:beta-lactamase class A